MSPTDLPAQLADRLTPAIGGLPTAQAFLAVAVAVGERLDQEERRAFLRSLYGGFELVAGTLATPAGRS